MKFIASSRSIVLIYLCAMIPDDFIDSLFARLEDERNELARILHDQMGGLMVAAAMDVSWLEANMRSLSPEERAKFIRVREGLKEAIDLKRVIIEKLRPTLLDTFGLFAALRWLVKNSCTASSVSSTESYLDPEPQFKPAAAIVLFRIVQEGVDLLMRREVRTLDLSIQSRQETLVVQISADGRLPVFADADTPAFAGLQHRVRSLGGEIHLGAPDAGRSLMAASLPLNELIESVTA